MRKHIHFFILVILVFLFSVPAWGSDRSKAIDDSGAVVVASADMFIDRVTLHRYVKNDDGTYSEFTRKGEFFKTVPADLPLLVEQKYTFPIKSDCYLLYSKESCLTHQHRKMILKACDPHPDGWVLDKAVVSFYSGY